jgi:hypothetical protein
MGWRLAGGPKARHAKTIVLYAANLRAFLWLQINLRQPCLRPPLQRTELLEIAEVAAAIGFKAENVRIFFNNNRPNYATKSGQRNATHPVDLSRKKPELDCGRGGGEHIRFLASPRLIIPFLRGSRRAEESLCRGKICSERKGRVGRDEIRRNRGPIDQVG